MPIITKRGPVGEALSMALIGLSVTVPAVTNGYTATKCRRLPDLIFGVDPTGCAVSRQHYHLEAGQCYWLRIGSTGRRTYAIVGPEFFKLIHVRRIHMDGKSVRPTGFRELSFSGQDTVDIVFVPITRGEFTVGAAGLEEQGAKTNIVVH